MVSMTVTVSSSLTDPDYPRIKRFVWLARPEGTTYRTGDHLTVLPTNDDDLVAGAPQVDLDTALSIMPSRPQRHGIAVDRPLTVRELLTRHIELQGRPTAAQLVTLAELNPCPPEKTALRSLADDEEARTGDQRTLLDSSRSSRHLREVLTWPTLLDLLSPLRPRHYSISSSPEKSPHHVDLMVSVLRAPARSGRGDFRGSASGYLNAVQPGDTVLARVQPCRAAFRITHDADTPVVMIAAGTGLAPFRGAIADRRGITAEVVPPRKNQAQRR
jgi:cytochrome P450/NADPH-cytochrome P450 reductase